MLLGYVEATSSGDRPTADGLLPPGVAEAVQLARLRDERAVSLLVAG